MSQTDGERERDRWEDIKETKRCQRGAHRATASKQTDGFGFQATLFTAPPTWTVFIQRDEQTSQNLTEPSSLPVNREERDYSPAHTQ